MREQILELERKALEELKDLTNKADTDAFKIKYLSKQGLITNLSRGMRDVPSEERPVVGELINKVKREIESRLALLETKYEEEALNEKLRSEKVDITEPSKGTAQGEIHPLHKIFAKLMDACVEMGFTVVTGPEVELDYYNFEALNVPKDHPARDMQDTFFLGGDLLMRTQTSSVQIRAMENMKPPLKIVSPGRTYRVDSDATHSPVFHQFEGLVIDENISMVDLKSMLTQLLKMLFGDDTKIRFRPSYFPFTEPSVEVDATCPMCKGAGCTRCKGTGLIELLGAGMVNPKVLENCGIDSNKYSGFAFGPGVDRLAMVAYKVPSIKNMFENDMKFLSQQNGEIR